MTDLNTFSDWAKACGWDAASRLAEKADRAAKADTAPGKSSQPAMNSPMRPFRVTVIDRNRKRTRYLAIARSWHDAWLSAANEYGLVALISVRPAIRPH